MFEYILHIYIYIGFVHNSKEQKNNKMTMLCDERMSEQIGPTESTNE